MSEKQGQLYLCATPIGNLEDITMRVLRVLKEADLIAAEDTRNSIRLLNHFDIHTPMTSYHEYNKIEKAYELIRKMQEGKNVALITDAGTPGISDPGEDLVRLCYEAGITVTSLPGACACVTALTPKQQSRPVPAALGVFTRKNAHPPTNKRGCAFLSERPKGLSSNRHLLQTTTAQRSAPTVTCAPLTEASP